MLTISCQKQFVNGHQQSTLQFKNIKSTLYRKRQAKVPKNPQSVSVLTILTTQKLLKRSVHRYMRRIVHYMIFRLKIGNFRITLSPQKNATN